MVFVDEYKRWVELNMEERKNDEIDKYLLVTEAVADLRRQPVDPAGGYDYDDLQETQLLLNEILLYQGQNDDWYQVEAIEQQDFSRQDLWRGLPGWVRKKSVLEVEKVKRNNVVIKEVAACVYREPDKVSKRTIATASMGTRFHVSGEIKKGFCRIALPKGGNGWVMKRGTRSMTRKVGEKQLRKAIVSTAKLFLGVPYLWGGRSAGPVMSDQFLAISENRKPGTLNREADVVRGVDCSGLVNLVFRANNVNIPRNAHVQWMVTPKITLDAMQPGDLIFMSKVKEFYEISHVMIFVGGDEFVEASEAERVVKINTFHDKFGKTLVELAKHDLVIENRKIYCGKIPVSK